MMKTRMCCSFWILVTAMLVWSTSGADGAQEKDNPKTLSPPSPSPSRPADLHGAGVHPPLHPPHLPDHEDFSGAPDRSPAGSAADDSPPLPDGFLPPDWQEKSPPYPDSSHPPEGPGNVTPEGRDDAQPLPGRLPVGQRPKWRSSFPSVHDSLPPVQSYGKVQPRLGWYAPKTPDDFPSHKGRYSWRRHSDDYPAKEPYNFPSHAGRYPPETPHDFPPHQGRRPPQPSPLDFSPRQGRYPPDWPDSFPPFPDTPVQPERDLLSVLETHRQSPEPDYDGRQAVFPELSPLPGKRTNPEENSQDRGPSSDHVEALMRRTLRREGRKRSRIRKLYKRLQRQKIPKNVRSSSKAQWPFHKNPFQQQLNLSRDDAGNVNHSRELNQHGQSDFTDESRKRAELDDFGKSAKTLTSSQQSEMSKESMHNSRELGQPLSPNVQQTNPAWKREPESRAKEKTAFDGLPQPFLDRKKAVSFLSRQPPPSKWRKWLKKLFKRDQKKRDQFNDAFSLHHVSHNTGDEDDNHDDDNDDDDGDGVTDHSDALFRHRKSYDIDGQGEVINVWKDSDDKSESDSSDVGQRVPVQADKESREEMHRGRKTPAETDKPADSSDNDFPDNYQRDSNLGKNQNKNHELSKRSNSRKINRKKTELRKPRALNWHHRPVQRKRRPQRRLQHMLNRGRKARGPKNLLPKLRRPNFPKDVLSNTKWLTPRRRVPPNRKRQTAKRPLPSPVKRKPHKRFPVRQRIQNRHRTPHRPKSRSPCGRLLPRCSFPSNKRVRGKINGGRRRKAKWFARRRPSRRQRHRKKDPSRRGWLAGNKKKRVHKKDCDDKTPVSSTAKQNPTFTFSTTEPIFPQRGGPTTSLPETSTTKSPVPSEKDQGGEEGREGLEPVRTVYLGAVEGPRLEAARVDVFRSGSNSSASSNSTPVFVRVNYKQQDQPLHSSAAGALERTKRNADDDQGNNGDDDSDDNENVTVSDDNDIRSQRRNRRRRMQRRRRERKRNRMNRLNRRRRLNNDGDDDADDISASSEDRQQGRRRGNYRQQRREGMNANVRDDDNDDSNDNDNDIEHNNDNDHDDNDVNNNIDQENDNDRDANDENDSNNNADNDEHDAATREEIRLNYRHQEREPTAIEVTVHDDENNDEEDNDDRQNRVVGFVHLGPSSRRNRQRTDSSDHQRNQLMNRNRRRRRLKKRRQRQRNRQRARQQRARLASSGDIRNAGNVSRESEPETPLSQVQAVSSDNGQGQGQQEAEAEAFIPSPFINHRTAYDFLSTQVRSRSRGEPGRGVNEQQAEHWQFNHRMSESMCEVFDKHFVPTTLGGRCV